MADHDVLDHEPDAGSQEERHDDGENEVRVEQPGRKGLAQDGQTVGRVGADGEEVAVRHVDDAHLPEDDGEAERHQQQDTEVAQAIEPLHGEDRHELRDGLHC
jgi:hypothetical protein